jgi:peptidoglycan/xylan/chitin deacetylase (PgdA/CDA1 family)
VENERYPYWPIVEREPIQWPNGARIAFWVIPNVEHFRFDQAGYEAGRNARAPDVYGYAARDYGNRVGVWRLMDAFDKFGIRATVALNSDVCRFHPQIIKAGVERNWEWMGHGISNSEPLGGTDDETQRGVIRRVVDTIAEHTGKAPRGWLGPGLGETFSTPDLLAEAGIEYVCDWCADDQPFPMRVKSGRLINVPYSLEFNDIPLFTRKFYTPKQVLQMTRDHFDVLYEEGARSGRVLALALHPYITGHPHRIHWLEQALKYITSHEGVWVTTGGEIADWYYQHYYDGAPK